MHWHLPLYFSFCQMIQAYGFQSQQRNAACFLAHTYWHIWKVNSFRDQPVSPLVLKLTGLIAAPCNKGTLTLTLAAIPGWVPIDKLSLSVGYQSHYTNMVIKKARIYCWLLSLLLFGVCPTSNMSHIQTRLCWKLFSLWSWLLLECLVCATGTAVDSPLS